MPGASDTMRPPDILKGWWVHAWSGAPGRLILVAGRSTNVRSDTGAPGENLCYNSVIPCSRQVRSISSGQMLAWISPMCAFCR